MSDTIFLIASLGLILINIVIITVAIILEIKKRKSKKQKSKNQTATQNNLENDEIFKKFVSETIKDFENKEDAFLIFYESSLSGFGIEKAKLDAAYDDISFAKERFSDSCYKLAKIGTTNVCLMEDENIDFSQKTTEKVTNDIIQVLPLLADFYREYDYLYKYVYTDLLLYGATVGANRATFGFFGEDNEKSREIRKHTLRIISEFFDFEIDTMIRVFLDLDKSVDIRNSTDAQIIHYLDIAEKMKEESLFLEFVNIWVSHMKNIGGKYTVAYIDLKKFFEELENEIKIDLPWFSLDYISLPSYSLVLKEQSEDECLRILELYKTGTLSGNYYSLKDPKYSA